jgi:hypothetical protein
LEALPALLLQPVKEFAMPSLPAWSGRVRPHRMGRRPSFRPIVEVLDERELPAITNLTPAGPLQAVFGTPFSGTLAVFQDENVTGQNAASVLGHLHATINWGDGHTSGGTITGPDVTGTLSVSGAYLFPSAQAYPVSITVQDDLDHSSASTLTVVDLSGNLPAGGNFRGPILAGLGGGSTSTSSTLSVTPIPVNATVDQLFTGAVGTIQDSTAGASVSNLAAVVDWGDGSRVDLLPVEATGTPGVFTILGSHFYVVSGTGTMQIWVQSLSDGRTAVTADSVTVSGTPSTTPNPSAPTSTPSTPAPGPGKPNGSKNQAQQSGMLDNLGRFRPVLHGRFRHFWPQIAFFRHWFTYLRV